MASADRIESLIEDDASLAQALEAVLGNTTDGEEVEWRDMKDDISSGQWGRLIETGILVDGDTGFRLADREAAEAAIEATPGATVETDVEADGDDDASWTTYDKAAAVAAIGLFAGYSVGPVRNAIGTTIDVLLGPLDQLLPFYLVILLLAVFTGLNSTLLQGNLMDTEKMAMYQRRMQAIQEKQKRAKERGDEEELEEIRQEQMEAMGENLGMFKLQFRPMVWIMLITIPFFLWMYWKILPQGGGQVVGAEPTVVMPLIGEVTQWTQGVLGPLQAWILWYFLCSMAFTQIVRKALDLDITPST